MVDIVIVMICFVLSAVIPQALYFILPILFLYTLWLQESLSINRVTKIYLGILIVVFIFLIVHIFSHQSIEYIFLKGFLRYFFLGLLLKFRCRRTFLELCLEPVP